MGRLIKIALIQQHASPDKTENTRRCAEAFENAARNGARIIVFAELAFTTFYPQQPASGDVLELAESIPGPTTDMFSELSKKWNVVTVLNLFERHGNKTFDSSPVINSNGSLLGTTRMAHIIEAPCFHEQGYYEPGDTDQPVYETAVGKIGVAICYDRHFPEYMRALGLMGAELVVVPQAGAVGEWPDGLFEAEMQVAGFQNGYFVALCNRVGKEEHIQFEGKSFVTSPDGRIIAQAPTQTDHTLFAEIDLEEVQNSHARRHFIPDRRPELYPPWLSSE